MGLLENGGRQYSEVVRPYLIGNDILQTAEQGPSRYIVDFGSRSLEEAMRFPLALELVRERVKPVRDGNRRPIRREKWWLLGELVPAMRQALQPLRRYIATSAVAKRFMFVWCGRDWCPSNRTIVFALDDDRHIGVLSSTIHTRWAVAQGGSFEDRPHYTHTSTFETFPWPAASKEEADRIGAAGSTLIGTRKQLCAEYDIGLTELYNRVEEGAHRDLRDLQVELDQAVLAAYGWPASTLDAPDESNRRLLELNQAIAAGDVGYDGPG